MHRVLIIGAGGVGGVVAHKCAANKDVFAEILLASRTKEKCDAIARSVKELRGRDIGTAIDGAESVVSVEAQTSGVLEEGGEGIVDERWPALAIL